MSMIVCVGDLTYAFGLSPRLASTSHGFDTFKITLHVGMSVTAANVIVKLPRQTAHYRTLICVPCWNKGCYNGHPYQVKALDARCDSTGVGGM